MFKKVFSGVLSILLVLSMLTLAFNIRPINAIEEETHPEFLLMTTTENVTVLENGTARLTILMNVPSSPLAEMYRKLLAAPTDANVGQEMPIPENATEKVHLGENVTEVQRPVREEFIKSIIKEQRLSLGLITEVSDSRMVPKGNGNECRVSIGGQAFFDVLNVTKIDSDDIWQIAVGSTNSTGITGLISTRLVFTKLMLESLQGEQAYHESWHTNIQLPVNATLLNSDELNGATWTIDFGGGTQMNASLALDQTSTIVINEEIIITEQNITATPDYLCKVLPEYKAFKIRYLLPNFGLDYPESRRVEAINTNWSHQFDYEGEFPEIALPIKYEFEDHGISSSIDMRLSAKPKFKVSSYVGWQFKWVWFFPKIDWFRASMTLQTSTRINLTATADINFEGFWQKQLYNSQIFHWKYTFSFYYLIPVLVDLDFKIIAGFAVNAAAHASFSVEALVERDFTAGLLWQDGSWSQIKSNQTRPCEANYTWWASASAEISITPEIRFRLALLFYSVAGPYVDFVPYATAGAKIVTDLHTWNVTLYLYLMFKVEIGITFEGWLKTLLSLFGCPPTYPLTTLLDFMIYNGTWPIYQAPIGPPLPSTKTHDLSVISMMSSPSIIFTDTVVNINASVRNNGDFNETSDVMLFQNDFSIGNYYDVNFTSGQDVLLPFSWDTTGLMPGNYTLKVAVKPVANETNQLDNNGTATIQIIQPSDIALLDVTVHPIETYIGRTVEITVVVKNLKNLTEDVNVTVSFNETAIKTQPIKELAPDEENILVFLWNTNGLSPGQTYLIWASATTLHCDINMTNNLFFSKANIAKVKIFGDVNGDEVIDGSDIVIIIDAVPSYLGHPWWNPQADLNNDGVVDGVDVVITLINLGKTT